MAALLLAEISCTLEAEQRFAAAPLRDYARHIDRLRKTFNLDWVSAVSWDLDANEVVLGPTEYACHFNVEHRFWKQGVGLATAERLTKAFLREAL